MSHKSLLGVSQTHQSGFLDKQQWPRGLTGISDQDYGRMGAEVSLPFSLCMPALWNLLWTVLEMGKLRLLGGPFLLRSEYQERMEVQVCLDCLRGRGVAQ